MRIISQKAALETVLAAMPGVRMGPMRSAAQLVCPSLSWLRGPFRQQFEQLRHNYRLNNAAIAGRPICDAVRKGMDFLLNADMAATPEAWQSGIDTSTAFWGWRVLMPAGVDFLGVTAPQGGGHDTGLILVVDDADQKDKALRLYHTEPQTPFDCPVGESLAKGLYPVEVRD